MCLRLSSFRRPQGPGWQAGQGVLPLYPVQSTCLCRHLLELSAGEKSSFAVGLHCETPATEVTSGLRGSGVSGSWVGRQPSPGRGSGQVGWSRDVCAPLGSLGSPLVVALGSLKTESQSKRSDQRLSSRQESDGHGWMEEAWLRP